MISRSAGFKVRFWKQPPFRGNFFILSCDIFSFFEFILLGNSSTAPEFSFNQINKLPENLYVTIGSVSAISLSSQRPRCFNNIIRYHNEIIKKAVVIRNNSLSFGPSFRDEGTFSVRAREKTMETVDWRPRKLRFQQREKTPLGRVLVVTAVKQNQRQTRKLNNNNNNKKQQKEN